MITTKADKLLRSLIDAGISLANFTVLATKVINIQRDFKLEYEDQNQRDQLRRSEKLREQNLLGQQLADEEQRRIKGLSKLRELGYVTNDETYKISTHMDENSSNHIDNRDKHIKSDQLLLPYSKEIYDLKKKQRSCCLSFNIDYDLRLNQQALERACRSAKRNMYELRAERFSRPEHRSILTVETITNHNKLKEAVREINKMFLDLKLNQDKRHLQELLTYINQFEGDIDLLICQMQCEPKVKETILFSPVTTDILDRMNIILHYVRMLAHKISNGNCSEDKVDTFEQEIEYDLFNIPDKITYLIKIKTNDDIGSSLLDTTNVFMKLHGTYDKSIDVQLLKSINKNKWQSGQLDIFNIELNYLGDIYAIEIWHDGQYSSWKVDWIEIIDDSANIYRFPLDRLFDKYSNEKKTRFIIQRDIGPINRLPSKPFKQIKFYKQIGFATYTVQVKTGKQPNKATDSLVFIQLKGENGSFTDNLCSANSVFKNSIFEPDQVDTFHLIWPYLSRISSLTIIVQSEGNQPVWFCEYVTVEDSQTGNQYKFIINQYFDGSNSDDISSKKHLTFYPENKIQTDNVEDKEKPCYLLKIKTGEVGLSVKSNTPSINLVLNGEKGVCEPYSLAAMVSQKKLFQANQIDEFVLSSKYYVGTLKSLLLSSDDQIDKWFIETMVIRDIIQGQNYSFPIFKWLNTEDKANKLISYPINEKKPDYIVYIRTIASELKAPDRKIKINIQGNKGNQDVLLHDPVTMYNTFQAGHKDEYFIENMKSLGDLQTIEIDITDSNIRKLQLDYIEIKDLITNHSYRFNMNRLLDVKNPKMISKAETIARSKNITSLKASHNQLSLPNLSNKKHFDQLTTNIPQGSKRPMHKEYFVSLQTDEKDLNTVKSHVHLQIFGNNGITNKIELKNLKINSKYLFEKYFENTFLLNLSDLGNLESIKFSIDEHKQTNLSISYIEIIDKNSDISYCASVANHQLNKKSNELAINLDSKIPSMSNSNKPSENIYKIMIKTYDKLFSNNDTKVQIDFIDENQFIDSFIINQTENDIETLKTNTIYRFIFQSAEQLKSLKAIKLSLVGTNFLQRNVFRPEFIEIFHLNTNENYRINFDSEDILDTEKNQIYLMKSIVNNIQRTKHIFTKTLQKNLTETISTENEDEEHSLLNNSMISSSNSQILHQDFNALANKIKNRHIRPGDRVKNHIRKQINSSINQISVNNGKQNQHGNMIQNKNHNENVKIHRHLSKWSKNLDTEKAKQPNYSRYTQRNLKKTPNGTNKNRIRAKPLPNKNSLTQNIFNNKLPKTKPSTRNSKIKESFLTDSSTAFDLLELNDIIQEDRFTIDHLDDIESNLMLNQLMTEKDQTALEIPKKPNYLSRSTSPCFKISNDNSKQETSSFSSIFLSNGELLTDSNSDRSISRSGVDALNRTHIPMIELNSSEDLIQHPINNDKSQI